jgi:hypothetical protein
MKLSNSQYYILFFALISFILFILVFKMIEQLVAQDYIVECFTSEKYDDTTSHTVNLPLNTTISCKNFCGPNARCAITGQQCFTDIDCPGCQPLTESKKKEFINVPGDNDSGKLTVGLTPQYSPLTSGYGTHEKIITNNMYEKPAQSNFGVDVWSKSFNQGQALFNQRYKLTGLRNMPNYSPTYSITGEFISDGPLPSNY